MFKKQKRGVSPPYNKNTECSEVRRLPTPKEVCIPMMMHSGKPAVPVVKVGDDVKMGQLIGEMGGFVSSPIHASVSGCVKSINERDPITGQKAVSVTIASDGLNTLCPNIKKPSVRSLQDFYDAVRDSGAVGLGGAGYPAAPKLAIKNLDELDYMLINGAECEPYVTADTNTMVADSKHVYVGVKLLMEFMRPKKIFICIEDNKPEAILEMQEVFSYDDNVEVKVLPTLYPQGERKVLVQNITGRVVPEGARLADVGVIVTNVTTVAVFARYIACGLPLIKKVVTVDGPSVVSPSNVLAPIGTSIRELFDFCGGFHDDAEPKKVLVGGPMMGIALPSLDMPVMKTTNCLIACSESSSNIPKETACIKCGKCLSVCPMRLMPPNVETAYTVNNLEGLKRYKVNMCVECGCCAYVCPARRHLVQIMQLSKQKLWLKDREDKAKGATS